MQLELTFTVLDGLETLHLFCNDFYAPSGSHVKPDVTQIYQNIKFMDYNTANREYGCNTPEYDWYVGLGFRKGQDIPSRVLRQKGRKRTYLFPVECIFMKIDGKPVDPGPELILSDMDIRSAAVYTRAGKITIKGYALTVAERENYVLRASYYSRAFEEGLASSSLVCAIPKDTWYEPEKYTIQLAKLVGKAVAKIFKDTNILTSRPLTEIALDTFTDALGHSAKPLTEEAAPIQYASAEERIRVEKMMREIIQAEAELKGMTTEEITTNYGDLGIDNGPTT